MPSSTRCSGPSVRLQAVRMRRPPARPRSTCGQTGLLNCGRLHACRHLAVNDVHNKAARQPVPRTGPNSSHAGQAHYIVTRLHAVRVCYEIVFSSIAENRTCHTDFRRRRWSRQRCGDARARRGRDRACHLRLGIAGHLAVAGKADRDAEGKGLGSAQHQGRRRMLRSLRARREGGACRGVLSSGHAGARENRRASERERRAVAHDSGVGRRGAGPALDARADRCSGVAHPAQPGSLA